MKKRANGEGTIYSTIQRNRRTKFLDVECDICKNCTSKCNRANFERCDKCKNCADCLKYCDRYYCYKTTKAQVTVNNQRKSAGTGKNAREVKEKKEVKSKQLNINTLMKNGELTLSEAMRQNEEDKLKYGKIKENSYNRNLDTITMIENYNIANLKINELTLETLEEFFSTLVKINTSQSCLEKVYDEIKQVCKNNEIFDTLKRNTFVSEIDKKDVVAFSIEEEKKLIEYINNNENKLVNDRKSSIDPRTIKNLIKFCLAFGTRIGESCCLKINTDIDMNNYTIKVNKTVTKNLDRKAEIGKTTKTGKKTKQRNEKDERIIPFGIIFDEEEVKEIIEEQIQNSVNDLLFSQKDGKLIEHSSFNALFKRICRQSGITKECNVHMMKHTAVTRMIENGIDIYVISALVGTTVEVLRKTYAHILDDFIQKEIKKSIMKRQENNLTLNEDTAITNCKIIPFSKIAK